MTRHWHHRQWSWRSSLMLSGPPCRRYRCWIEPGSAGAGCRKREVWFQWSSALWMLNTYTVSGYCKFSGSLESSGCVATTYQYESDVWTSCLLWSWVWMEGHHVAAEFRWCVTAWPQHRKLDMLIHKDVLSHVNSRIQNPVVLAPLRFTPMGCCKCRHPAVERQGKRARSACWLHRCHQTWSGTAGRVRWGLQGR